jgi:hypothetical protein
LRGLQPQKASSYVRVAVGHVKIFRCQTHVTGWFALLSLCLQAVLESIRDSLNEQLVIPEWLVDIFLGYGDAGAAHYTAMPGLLRTVDFKVGACFHERTGHAWECISYDYLAVLALPWWAVAVGVRFAAFVVVSTSTAAHYTAMPGLLRTVDFKVGAWWGLAAAQIEGVRPLLF